MYIPKASQRKPTQVQPYRWTRQEYEKMVEIGLFPSGTRLELIEGEILEMAAHTSYHAAATTIIQRYLERMYGADRKSTRLNSSHSRASRMPSSA